MNLSKSIEYYSNKNPKKKAIIHEGHEISYSELNHFVNKTANGLRSLGVSVGDRVAIMLPNIPEFIYLFYACQKIGAIAVTVNTMYKGNEVQYILKDSGSKVLICLTNFLSTINEVKPELPLLEHIITIGERSVNILDPSATLYLQMIFKKNEVGNLDELYKDVGDAIIETLRMCGVKDAWYKHRGGIRHKNGRKIAGVMIYEIEDIFIVNILIFTSDFDMDSYLAAIWVPPEVRDKVVEPIISIKECLNENIETTVIIKNFINALEKKIGISLEVGKMNREENFAFEKQKALACKKVKRTNESFLKKLIGTLFK